MIETLTNCFESALRLSSIPWHLQWKLGICNGNSVFDMLLHVQKPVHALVFNRAPSRENLSSRFPIRSDTNLSVQPQKMVRGVKFRFSEVEGLYHLCSKNKGTDQLCGRNSMLIKDSNFTCHEAAQLSQQLEVKTVVLNNC